MSVLHLGSDAQGVNKNRTGFTLVEVIVVIVIIAILAAIGVPALTGYIDKAKDKEYEMEARNHAIAIHATLVEAYANGEFSSAEAKTYLAEGDTAGTVRCFGTEVLSKYASPDGKNGKLLYERAYALEGEVLDTSISTTGKFWLDVAGSEDATALTADAFLCGLYFGGPGDKFIIVTHKMDRLDIADGATPTDFYNKAEDFAYNHNAGYEVYHLIRT